MKDNYWFNIDNIKSYRLTPDELMIACSWFDRLPERFRNKKDIKTFLSLKEFIDGFNNE